MNAHIHAEDHRSTLIELDDRPRTLRLPVGAALFALRGEIWLTQEGRRDDFILGSGSRYDVGDRAPIVVSATHDRAELYVALPPDARAVAATDLHAFLRDNAARLRREEIDRVFAAATRRAGRVAGPRGWLDWVCGVASRRGRAG